MADPNSFTALHNLAIIRPNGFRLHGHLPYSKHIYPPALASQSVPFSYQFRADKRTNSCNFVSANFVISITFALTAACLATITAP